MSTVLTLILGLAFGFIAGWLVRDSRDRPLVAPGERFGVGVPDEWYRRQQARSQRPSDERDR